MEICESVFIVTGGGSGLGAATVMLLAELGGHVVIADIDDQKGVRLAEEIHVPFHPTDIADEASVVEMVQTVKARFGEVHGLVNCAGILAPGRILQKDGSSFPLPLFRRGIEVNLIGTFNVLRLVAAEMRDNGPDHEGERGVIINTASIAAYEGQIGQACYAAGKAGVIGMTLPAARELSRFGIRVVTVAPGLFDTPLLADLPNERRRLLHEQVVFPPRLGKPQEFAALVRHIIENPMINGTVIRLDGALRMAAK